MTRNSVFVLLAIFLWFSGYGGGFVYAQGAIQQQETPFEDPAAEERARKLMKEIRCLVCQNQSIDDSDADLAKDLRMIVRELMIAGDSDQDIRDYLVVRYGDWVLLTPPIEGKTLLLWSSPVLLLIFSAFMVWRRTSRRSILMTATTEGQNGDNFQHSSHASAQTDGQDTEELSPREQQKLAALLSMDDDQSSNDQKGKS